MNSLRISFLRSSPRTLVRSPALSMGGRRFASQDYGSGEGDPKGENPQAQGANPSADLEHPGPPPPKAGQGSGSTPTKGTSTGHNTGESPSSPSKGQKKSFSTMARRFAKDDNKGTQGAQPKILSESPPAPKDQPEDVKQHNKEMDNRAEQAAEKVNHEDTKNDKVSKQFW